MTTRSHHTGLVLSGGGARGAYQAGVLLGLASVLERSRRTPFGIVCGTSAGAINAAMLASRAEDFRVGVARLVRLWRSIRVSDIYHADLGTLSRHGLKFLASVVGVGSAPENAASMLDNAPLGAFLERTLDLARIPEHCASGRLGALGVNVTSYASGKAVTFFCGARDKVAWQRTRRRGERCMLSVPHLMASAAIPFIFPAVRIDGEYYMDGSMRQIAPLSPALHLGARRVVVIGVGQFGGQSHGDATETSRYPSFAQTAGHALSSIFLDNIGADLERLMQMNRLVGMVPRRELTRHRLALHHVDALLLAPTIDIGELSLRYADLLPSGVRTLLHRLGSTHGTGSSLTSYLLFDSRFCRALVRQGYRDTLARRDEVVAFLDPRRSRFVPLNWATPT
ncbi:MAG TPA: patatin-like phospholipase family protein [Casimicrobiaceae bacterium]|nr:patatin-like phospholipase family protein [Casimicrobiaceae bacterium]